MIPKVFSSVAIPVFLSPLKGGVSFSDPLSSGLLESLFLYFCSASTFHPSSTVSQSVQIPLFPAQPFNGLGLLFH